MGVNSSSPDDVKNAASRLDRVLGVTVSGSDISKALAWRTINNFYESKFGRAMVKPMCVARLVSASGEVEPQLVAALRKTLSEDADALVEQLMVAIQSVHLRVLPKACLGFAGLYRQLGEHQPMKFAHEHGCRQYDIIGSSDTMASVMPPTMLPEMVIPPTAWTEFEGIDTSDTVFNAYCMLMVRADNVPNINASMVREQFNKLRAEMAPIEAERGLPLIDCYIMSPVSVFQMPGMHGHGCFSDFWREAEKLVDEGLVRSLGVTNATIHQIESLLEFAKHRPVMHTFERHLLNQVPEMVQFCKDNRIAPRAHVCLAKTDVFELECCIREDMSPAQAAIKWNIQDDVSACFGVDKLEHIVENFKVPKELMHLPPVVASKPANPLLKLYPMMSMNLPGVFMQHGNREDTGILRKDADGRWWPASSNDSGVKWFERLNKMSAGQESLMNEMEEVLSGLGKYMKASERRRIIQEKIAEMTKGRATDSHGSAMKTAQEKGTGVHEEAASAFHQINDDGGAKGLTQMVVIPFSTLRDNGAIPRRSVLNPQQVHVPVTALGPDDHVIFFSQRWLTPSPRAAATPDDAAGTKHKQLMTACRAYGRMNGIKEKNIWVWMDFSSVDQDDDEELIKGVNSLALYVCSCDAFISIDHADYFSRGWCLMECMFADASKTPRYILSSNDELKPMDINMRLGCKPPCEGSFTVESDREIMKILEEMGSMITVRLDRGIAFNFMDDAKTHQVSSDKSTAAPAPLPIAAAVAPIAGGTQKPRLPRWLTFAPCVF